MTDGQNPALEYIFQQAWENDVDYEKDYELRFRINGFLVRAFGLPEDDYYGRLDLKNLLALKAALSDVNNALTMQLTLAFLDWAAQMLSMDVPAISLLRKSVLETKPSSNGYDLYCSQPIPFIAEVKCNVPINGGVRYGSAQRNGILKDIDALLSGKSKASPIAAGTLKFMVFPDLPEVRSANAHLLTSRLMLSKPIRFIGANERPTDLGTVYGGRFQE